MPYLKTPLGSGLLPLGLSNHCCATVSGVETMPVVRPAAWRQRRASVGSNTIGAGWLHHFDLLHGTHVY
jgi:hypothetical protein